MPSLKMKTKSSAGCLREQNGLRVCQKSFVVAKNPSSPVRVTHQTAELDAGFQNNQEVCLCNEVPAQDTGDEKVSDSNELMMEEDLQFQKQMEEDLQFQKQLSSIISFASAERVEPTPPNSPSNNETKFSPVLEPSEVPSERVFTNNAGSNEDLTAAHLREDNCEDAGRSLSEYQTSLPSDFSISDMILATPIDADSMYDDFKDTTCLSDFRCDEPNFFFDYTEEYMALPSLEDTMEAKSVEDVRTYDESIIKLDDSSLYFAIHQLKSCNQDQDVSNSESDHLENFDPQMFLRNLPDLPDAALDCQASPLQIEFQKKKSVTLVLDLDETLVHSTLEPCEDADFNFPVFFNMKEHMVYVRKRPYLRLFLERVAEMFEIVVFTASQSIYAEQLLDKLDPDGKFISRRAYRESCIFSDGSYTKDLTVLGVDLAKVAIIDNSPQVFRLQVNNGIPIKSWFDDSSDCALIQLLPFLETLADADDVRPIIAKRFNNDDENESQEVPAEPVSTTLI